MNVELACPRDRGSLQREGAELVCAGGHRYSIVGGIPVFLLEETEPTHAACRESGAEVPSPAAEGIDPVVRELLAATCGRLYRDLGQSLRSYPIPELRLPDGEGALFLDVGCGWGRWSVAAARRGYRAVGIDPSLKAVRAAARVAPSVSTEAEYLVGDARHLPFPDGSFDVVFSYSVLQHFRRADAATALEEIGRVLRPNGLALLQFANAWGPGNLLNQLRERRFREPRRLFDVRYWRPAELLREAEGAIGPARLEADGFFTLNAQSADLPVLPRRYRAVVRASEALRSVGPLARVADSVYVRATKAALNTPGTPSMPGSSPRLPKR